MDVFQAMSEMRAMRRIKPDPVDPDLIRDLSADLVPEAARAI